MSVAMVAVDGHDDDSTLYPPSSHSQDPDEADYTSLKRSLSRIHKPTHLTNPLSISSDSPNNDSKLRKGNHAANQMHLNIPQAPLAAETALAALQHLPTPLIVLSSLKTIVLANEAMGRLLGLRDNQHSLNEDEHDEQTDDSITDILSGQTLSQIGIDMISDGIPIWYVTLPLEQTRTDNT